MSASACGDYPTRAVVVLRLRAAQKVAAAAASADQKLQCIRQAGLALAVPGMNDCDRRVKVELRRFGAERAEATNLNGNNPVDPRAQLRRQAVTTSVRAA